MTSFSQEHAPPPRPLGPEIPAGVRVAITTWFAEHGDDSQEIRLLWFQRAGVGNAADVGADVRDRWGEDAQALMVRDLEYDRMPAASVTPRPAPSTVTFPRLSTSTTSSSRSRSTPATARWSRSRTSCSRRAGSTTASTRTVTPAGTETRERTARSSDLLSTRSTTTASRGRDRSSSQLGHLRAGTAKDLEDAIEEAGKAVRALPSRFG
jgi:hypothetical protein